MRGRPSLNNPRHTHIYLAPGSHPRPLFFFPGRCCLLGARESACSECLRRAPVVLRRLCAQGRGCRASARIKANPNGCGSSSNTDRDTEPLPRLRRSGGPAVMTAHWPSRRDDSRVPPFPAYNGQPDRTCTVEALTSNGPRGRRAELVERHSVGE